MKRFTRLFLLLLLFACAIGWSGLMSIDFLRERATPASDGSSASITYFDYNQSAFSDVTVYLSVLDGNGQPVLGLAKDAFAIYEDETRVNITGLVQGGEQPVTAVMMIDQSGSMESSSKMQDAKSAASTFLDHLENGRDRVGVLAFNSSTTELGSLRLIDDAVRSDLDSRIRNLDADGGTAYYDTIYQAIDMLRGVEGRKVVLALTDGQDTSSSRGRNTVTQHAQDNLVVIYTIGLGRDVERSDLERIAEETRGEYYEEPTGSELADLYAGMAQGLQDEYSMVYRSPTPQLDGTTRQVQVTVNLPSGTATAVGSYAVGGTLTPSLNLWPCLGILPLLVLLVLPGLFDRLRGRGRLAESEWAAEPIPPPSPPLPAEPPAPAAPAPAAPPPPTVAAACLNCGAALRTGARFCRECGQPVVAAPQPAPTCAHCGAQMRAGARFCRTCGQQVTASPAVPTCSHCGVPLQPGIEFCANCGQRV
jgi:VWFA-related protein